MFNGSMHAKVIFPRCNCFRSRFKKKMVDSTNDGLCDGDEIFPDLAVEGVINISLEEDQLDLFITPSNINELDLDSEDDGYLIDALCDDSLLNVSVRELAAAGGLAETSGVEAGKREEKDRTLTLVSPTPGAIKSHDQCSAGVFDLGFSLVSQEEEGDILSLRTRIEKNNPNLCLLKDINESLDFAKNQMYPFPGNAVSEKPAKGKPKKGLNTKNSTKIAKKVSKETVDKSDKKLTKPRFHSASEEEIAKLQMDSEAERTHNQTRWGISILRGRPLIASWCPQTNVD